ncbi:hypothetical protein Pla123a_19610 [Posidoniimonas polymericola]|uniref:Intein C-terminal splicing domain-containing protein n=1 Tax=Posidoniimonas polymericola TaxID=2528002 RepID=A0A5C5YR11_9BACT|nr:polymorphic toxin-type HINT domain-containing protein [Posidoniimonas polymericola]TWT77303.1 hypothetical protein Pla123a_19610 [Posidoniimonas polymericola]
MPSRIRDLLIVASLLTASALFLWRGSAQPPSAERVVSVTPASLSSEPQYEPVPQAIETITVGQRMWIGENPSAERDHRVGADITAPSEWRQMTLRCPKRDGTLADVVMLRPVNWLTERQVRPGGKVQIDVPECGISGLADVLAVGPCPEIAQGPGRVVTATFHHHAASTIYVAIEGVAEPIGTTPNHPFWSEAKQAFVRADQLSPGDEVRTLDGTACVLSLGPRGPPEPVYNLEVQFEHVYRIGDAGVLVHNGTPENCFDWARRKQSEIGGSVVRIDSPNPTRGKIPLPKYDADQYEHAVLVKGGKAYDPLHPEGIPARDYFDQVRKLNGYRSLGEARRNLGIRKN